MNTAIGTAHAPCANTIGQHIVDSACQLITDQGFSGMSMRRLAKTVGLHAGSLYYHFPSKQDLLEEVMEHLHQKRLASWRREKSKHRSTRPRLEAFIRFNVQRHLHCEPEERLLKMEACHLDPVQQKRILEQERVYMRELECILRRGMKEGIFQSIDAEVVTCGILGLTSCTVTLKQHRNLPEPTLVSLINGMVKQLLSTATEPSRYP
ncbi:TetR/AcrR family transcriptional regulator [Pseudomonas syringae]|uniref:TetR/AcrR family transcriptional regulator n=1 Tax=Pseudomonas syringae TaxID=317 RepID=UPI001672CB30|nr:TetR/AcrR family transcriptional regulator [Pseudomonas syringae]